MTPTDLTRALLTTLAGPLCAVLVGLLWLAVALAPKRAR
jgi:hypothetical protein